MIKSQTAASETTYQVNPQELSGASLNYLTQQATANNQVLSEYWRESANADGSLRVDRATYQAVMDRTGRNASIAETEGVNAAELAVVTRRSAGTYHIHVGDSIVQQLEQAGFLLDNSRGTHVGLCISGTDVALMQRAIDRLQITQLSPGTEATVHLRIGFNDIKNWYQNDGTDAGLLRTIAEASDALSEIISRLRGLDADIVVESVLPVAAETAYGDGAAMNRGINMLNNSYRQLAQTHGVSFSDDSSSFVRNSALNAAFAGNDGVHLSREGLQILLRATN